MLLTTSRDPSSRLVQFAKVWGGSVMCAMWEGGAGPSSGWCRSHSYGGSVRGEGRRQQGGAHAEGSKVRHWGHYYTGACSDHVLDEVCSSFHHWPTLTVHAAVHTTQSPSTPFSNFPRR